VSCCAVLRSRLQKRLLADDTLAVHMGWRSPDMPTRALAHREPRPGTAGVIAGIRRSGPSRGVSTRQQYRDILEFEGTWSSLMTVTIQLPSDIEADWSLRLGIMAQQPHTWKRLLREQVSAGGSALSTASGPPHGASQPAAPPYAALSMTRSAATASMAIAGDEHPSPIPIFCCGVLSLIIQAMR